MHFISGYDVNDALIGFPLKYLSQTSMLMISRNYCTKGNCLELTQSHHASAARRF